jgi:hypothetical protein
LFFIKAVLENLLASSSGFAFDFVVIIFNLELFDLQNKFLAVSPGFLERTVTHNGSISLFPFGFFFIELIILGLSQCSIFSLVLCVALAALIFSGFFRIKLDHVFKVLALGFIELVLEAANLVV